MLGGGVGELYSATEISSDQVESGALRVGRHIPTLASQETRARSPQPGKAARLPSRKPTRRGGHARPGRLLPPGAGKWLLPARPAAHSRPRRIPEAPRD